MKLIKTALFLGALLMVGLGGLTRGQRADPVEGRANAQYFWAFDVGQLYRGAVGSEADGLYWGSGVTVGSGSSTNAGPGLVEFPTPTFESVALTPNGTADNLEASIGGWPVYIPTAGKLIHMGFQGSLVDAADSHFYFGLVIGGYSSVTNGLQGSTGGQTGGDQIGIRWQAGTTAAFELRVYDNTAAEEDILSLTGIAPTSGEDFEIHLKVDVDTVWVYAQDEDSEFDSFLALANNGPATDLSDLGPTISVQNEGAVQPGDHLVIHRAWVSQDKRFGTRASFVDVLENPFP